MSHRCPSCQRVLYNRRLKACGFCGAPIPEELRFTPEEVASLDRQMAEVERQGRQRGKAAAKEAEGARRHDAGDCGISLTGFMS